MRTMIKVWEQEMAQEIEERRAEGLEVSGSYPPSDYAMYTAILDEEFKEILKNEF